MVTTVFSSSYKVRLGDNATPGQGTYEVYLNPLHTMKNITFLPMPATEYESDGDVSGIGYAGGLSVPVMLQQMKILYNATFRENFEKALVYWSKQDTLLYITAKIDATDWLTFPDYATQAMTAFRGKVRMVQGYEVTPETIDIATIQIKRYTS